jgi:hypothetical protein
VPETVMEQSGRCADGCRVDEPCFGSSHVGDGEFDIFRKMAEPVVCASAIMTPQNVASETERLIAAALYHRRPVYKRGVAGNEAP